MSAPAESAELLGASSRERVSERVLLSAACTSVTSALFFFFFFICGADEDTLAGVKEFGLFLAHFIES